MLSEWIHTAVILCGSPSIVHRIWECQRQFQSLHGHNYFPGNIKTLLDLFHYVDIFTDGTKVSGWNCWHLNMNQGSVASTYSRVIAFFTAILMQKKKRPLSVKTTFDSTNYELYESSSLDSIFLMFSVMKWKMYIKHACCLLKYRRLCNCLRCGLH